MRATVVLVGEAPVDERIRRCGHELRFRSSWSGARVFFAGYRPLEGAYFVAYVAAPKVERTTGGLLLQ